jgi:bifunctional DNA-binding transcriptional regulator/antitoxin component of YhaV-PrlF toxin-antitoxin module
MNMKIYKILGKRGRITLPLEIRQEMGFAFNDVVSFERTGDAVTVRREKVCEQRDAAPSAPSACAFLNQITEQKRRATLFAEMLDDLTAEELRTALIRLSVRWAEMQSEGDGDG